MYACKRSIVTLAVLAVGSLALAQDNSGMPNQKVPPPGDHGGAALRAGEMAKGKMGQGSSADEVINSQLAKFAAMADTAGDQKFALVAGCGNMGEVEFSKVVAAKASDPQVKSLAQMMVTEHSAAQDKLTPIGQKLGVMYPSELPTTKQEELKFLSNLPTEKMEKAYLSMMKADHLKAVNDYTDHLPMIKDPDLKAYATETLAKIREHTATVLKTADAKGLPLDLTFGSGMAMSK